MKKLKEKVEEIERIFDTWSYMPRDTDHEKRMTSGFAIWSRNSVEEVKRYLENEEYDKISEDIHDLMENYQYVYLLDFREDARLFLKKHREKLLNELCS